MAKIIAIHGLIGHGKDTLGRVLAHQVKGKKYKASFALKVKQNVQNITGVEMEIQNEHHYDAPVWDYSREQKQTPLKDYNMTLGEMLQIYATEAVRDNIHEDVWANACLNGIPEDSEDTYIITDLRFENEVKALRERDAILIKIIRPYSDLEKGRDHNHISERGLDSELFDYVLMNDKTIDDLFTKTESFMNTFNKIRNTKWARLRD